MSAHELQRAVSAAGRRGILKYPDERRQLTLVESLNTELTEKNLLIQQLNDTISNLKERISRQEAKNKLIQASFDDIERDYNEVIKRLNTSEVEKLHQQQIQEKEVQIKQLQTESTAKSEQIRLLSENLSTLESRNKLYLAQLEEITSYKQAIAQLAKDNQVLQNQLTDAVSQLEKLSKDETDYKRLSFKFDQLQQQNFQENVAFKNMKTELNTTIDRQRLRIRLITDKVVAISQNNAFELLQVKKSIQCLKSVIKDFKSRLLSADAANILYMQVNAIILEKHKSIENQLIDSQEAAVKTALTHFKQQTLNSLQKPERCSYQFFLPKIIQYQNNNIDSPEKIENLVEEHRLLTFKLNQAEIKVEKLEKELKETQMLNQALQKADDVFKVLQNKQIPEKDEKAETQEEETKLLPKERLAQMKNKHQELCYHVIKRQNELLEQVFGIKKLLNPEVSYETFVQHADLCREKSSLEQKIQDLNVFIQTMQEQHNSGKFIDMLGQITVQTVDPLVKVCELVFDNTALDVSEILAKDTFELIVTNPTITQ